MNDIPYIIDGCHSDDLQQLKQHPLIKQFAAVKPDTYQMVKLVNPTLFLFMQLAKKIVEDEE
ncbi:hypothetical protein [uncultured Methanomethylovorans sp.]|uniref:hypothetical protein n=1 Tax=uncultured Methanomethylovorans sp. TaxID=183759 RepID=UPI00262E5924|nr:hypothetical protein [uncultured Methanomethylovorans sp.]